MRLPHATPRSLAALTCRKTRCLALVGSTVKVLDGRPANDWMDVLEPYERARAESFRYASSRESYVAAHLLVRNAAALLIGCDARHIEIAQCCDQCGGPHGRPRVKGFPHLHVSLSHTTDAVAAAASDLPIGIDIEASSGVNYAEGVNSFV